MKSKASHERLGRRPLGVLFSGYAVACNGLLLIIGTLHDQLLLHMHHGHFRLSDVQIGIPLIAGLTLLYLSSSLLRQKRTAWTLVLGVYIFVISVDFAGLLAPTLPYHIFILRLIRGVVLPLLIIVGLVVWRQYYSVKSDLQTFSQSVRIIVVVLLVAFFYGVGGFLLMDSHDFHQEISVPQAIHQTVDQFGLTTKELHPYTRRAKLFLDSLSIISVAAVGYALISLFQPLKARFADQVHNREIIADLLQRFPASSEDYFKLWPHDKLYFINDQRTAGVALHVYHRVALVVGDLAGDPQAFNDLLVRFDSLCHVNDWMPAFIHVEPKLRKLYELHNFSLQKIGEEAVLNLQYFSEHVATNKYFRNIRNKFDKQGCSVEVLQPPHNHAVIERLGFISKDWLSRPGREERGLLMGYYSDAYMQQCNVMVVRDAAGTIQAFVNQVSSFEKYEANFDLLRQTTTSPTNINDYLLLNFAEYARNQGFHRLNLGLCPLAGLDKKEADSSVIDSGLRFAYANGDRFYSFSGLERFKAKYEPEWSDRFIAYRGGIRGFTRTLTALNRAMKVRHKIVP
jgi:phosphatidylglycerol lysyltransferase